jgi:peptidoglycan/xylan/chitin deacetylase (PgdA/CDA1 family)
VSPATRLSPDGVAIFLFHGVVTAHRHAVRNYTRKHLDVPTLAAVLDELRAAGAPVSLPEILAATVEGRPLPPRAFAITFDDGFANNAVLAAPLLRARSLPATFYVTTGFVDGDRASWTDMIEDAIERTERVRLDLPGLPPGREHRTAAEKIALLDAIRAFVKGRPDVDPGAYAREVRRQLGVDAMTADPELDAKLSWKQVRQLDEDPLFTVGGHGHTHRILEYLDDAELEEEIATSVGELALHLGHPVEHYSYPEGLATCYSDRVIARLRAHGIACAPTAEPGINPPGTDPFRLKRLSVP